MKKRGFTLVELLIVIVVIAILAAITIVAYTGVTNKANDAAIQSDLSTMRTQLTQFFITNGYYPTTDADIGSVGLKPTRGAYSTTTVGTDGSTSNNLLYCFGPHGSTTATDFSLIAVSKSGNSYEVGASGGVIPFPSVITVMDSTTLCPASVISSYSSRQFLYQSNAWRDVAQ